MKLIDTKLGTFRVIDNKHEFEADWNTVKYHMVFELDVDPEEIEFAQAEMRRNKHDTAHFGIHYLFTHTSSSELVSNVVTELRVLQELRAEFHNAYLSNPDSAETRDAHRRLMSLYSALNVSSILHLVEARELKGVA